MTQWVSVLLAGSWVEAEVAKGRLEAEGIHVEIWLAPTMENEADEAQAGKEALTE